LASATDGVGVEVAVDIGVGLRVLLFTVGAGSQAQRHIDIASKAAGKNAGIRISIL
jgi:hypothetical protein